MLKKHPFLRLLIPLIIGILLEYYLNIPIKICAITFATLFIGLLSSAKISSRSNLIFGLILNAFLISTGALLLNLKSTQKLNTEQDCVFLVQITEIPIEKQKSFKSEAKIIAIENQTLHKTSGKIILYFEKSTDVQKLKSGQQILFRASLSDIPKNANRIGFDYSKYLATKGILHSAYLKQKNWTLVNSKNKSIKCFALNLRQKIVNKFEKANINSDALGVISALTIGYKSNLTNDIKVAYSGAGAMHVLAVSGLHVGIVFFILNTFLGLFKFLSKKPQIKHTIIILCLWAYALTTGLSASVTRASLMFTFVLFGYIVNKKINIYNSLASSAFVLLLINPFLLFDVGFQLSYSAVTGIVFFQPKIYKLLSFNSNIANAIWALSSVSFAAQISTSPLCLLYFHQFPSYFWLSNIFVILAATILIYLTVTWVSLGFFPFADKAISFLVKRILNLNNQFIYGINRLPGAVNYNIPFEKHQAIIMYLFIILAGFWITTAKKKHLFAGLFVFMIFAATYFFEEKHSLQQQIFTVYHLKKQSSLQWVSGSNSITMYSESSNNKMLNQLICDSQTSYRLKQNKNILITEKHDTVFSNNQFYYNNGFWKFANKNGLILHTNSKKPHFCHTKTFDFLVVTGSPTFSLSDMKNIHFKQIIIDGSVPLWEMKNWTKSNTKTYITSTSGAFVLKP